MILAPMTVRWLELTMLGSMHQHLSRLQSCRRCGEQEGGT